MKVAVISDTHGSLKWLERALELSTDAELILHCGDVLYHGPRNPLPDNYNPAAVVELLNSLPPGKILFVRGNCDADIDVQLLKHDLSLRFRTVRIEHLRVGMVHGDQFRGKEAPLNFGKELHLEVVLFGHTHRKRMEEKNGILILNPGSVALPKDGTHSLAFLEVEGNHVRVSLYDLEKGQVVQEGEFELGTGGKK